MVDEILDKLLDMVQMFTGFDVVLGSNPTKESIALVGYGNPDRIFRDKDTDWVLNVTINGRKEATALPSTATLRLTPR